MKLLEMDGFWEKVESQQRHRLKHQHQKNLEIGSMRLLGIDPGTACGYAVLDTTSGLITSGVWSLQTRRHEGGGMRFLRLQHYLAEIIATVKPDAIAYEEVHRHLGTAAAHVYGGIIALIAAACEGTQTPYKGIPVQTVKKFATGKGNADKNAMMAAAATKWPDVIMSDDNEADARFIVLTLAQQLTSTQPGQTPPGRTRQENPAGAPKPRRRQKVGPTLSESDL